MSLIHNCVKYTFRCILNIEATEVTLMTTLKLICLVALCLTIAWLCLRQLKKKDPLKGHHTYTNDDGSPKEDIPCV